MFSTPVPLAIGIAREIREASGEAPISKMRLSQALHYWTHGWAYLTAVEAGQRRVHLDGSDAGEPDEAARQYARDILAWRAARRRAGKRYSTWSARERGAVWIHQCDHAVAGVAPSPPFLSAKWS